MKNIKLQIFILISFILINAITILTLSSITLAEESKSGDNSKSTSDKNNQNDSYVSEKDIFNQATMLFNKAMMDTDKRQKKEIFLQTASLYHKLIDKYEIVNGYLFYNLGNCYYNAGVLGKSILYYRLAECLIPNNEDLKNNLQVALSKSKDQIQSEQLDSIFRSIFFWHYLLSPMSKIWWLAIFFILIWLSLAIYIFWRKNFLKYIIVVSSIFSVILAISLTIHIIDDGTKEIGVITTLEATAKNGPGDSYKDTFKGPLHEGTEFTVIDTQDKWYQVVLKDGKICWLKSLDVEIAKLKLFSF